MVAALSEVKDILKRAFPGIRFTSGVRTQEEQDALVAQGATRARNSQHVHGTGLDMVLPKGVKHSDVTSVLADNGVDLSENLNETGKGSNQGTGAHLHIGWGAKAKGGDPNSGGGSTFDRVTSERSQNQAPSISAIYEAYRSGEMEPQEAAQFEHDVNNGAIMLPRGAKLKSKPSAPTLPAGVVKAYNSHEMSDEDRAQVDADLRDGVYSLPKGATLKRPAPRSGSDMFGMGVRAVETGGDSLGDIVAGPINSLVNMTGIPQALTGSTLSTSPFRDAAESHADALKMARPESDSEKLASAVIEGSTQGLLTSPIAGVMGVEGTIGNALKNPILDTVSGGASGASGEYARQSGAGPVGQMAASLVGGVLPVGAVGAVERGAARLSSRRPATIHEVAAQTPREVVIDRAGNLTPDGQEYAIRHNVTPEEVRAAFDAPPNVRTANDAETPAVAREATTDAPVVGEPVHPVPQRPTVEGPAAAEAVPPEAAPVARAAEPALPQDAAARLAQAQSEGIALSRGEATKNFDIMDAENRLRNSNGPEADEARQFKAQQAEQIKGAVDRFRSAFGDTEATAADRGEIVREALRDLRDEGKAGVSALYKQASELPGHDIPLDPDPILEAADKLILETPMEQSSKDALERALAKFGLLGNKVEKTGRYASVVTDDGRKIRILGEVEPLTLTNAEAFRQALNQAYDKGTGLMGRAIKALDDTVDAAIEKGAADERNAAFKRARQAASVVKRTYEAKDVISDIIGWKAGTFTDKLKPEDVIRVAFSGDVTNLKRVKAILLSKSTEQSRAAWQALKAHGIANIFEKATTRNANISGEITDVISGAKLRSEMARFGTAKLKVLLDDSEFNQLMKLSRVIGDATIPITGTVNHSNSANLLMRLSSSMVSKIPVIGGMTDVAQSLVRQAKEIASARETLKGVTEYTPSAASAETAPAGRAAASPGRIRKATSAAKDEVTAFYRAFLDIAGSERMLAPLLVSANQGDKK